MQQIVIWLWNFPFLPEKKAKYKTFDEKQHIPLHIDFPFLTLNKHLFHYHRETINGRIAH